ncbi:hypothetical protein M0R45_029519 [Rubus argutus]|uniref:SBP-type domain-containing protein n=1 Tax=Rubus argutus TaxID=59490 RepID=A0AAW1WC94_RUBAR
MDLCLNTLQPAADFSIHVDMRSLSAGSHSKSSKGASIWSLSQSPTPRVRVSGMHSQTTYDQVYGCNKDFNSLKDHQKRNELFEGQTTVKVIANGIKQKFCLQCSRFHVPAEVDDGKHSCCKHLAGRAWRFQLYNGNAETAP